MSSQQRSDEFEKLLVSAGLSIVLARTIAIQFKDEPDLIREFTTKIEKDNLSSEEVLKQINEKETLEPKKSGMLNALTKAGFAAGVASAIILAISDDEKIVSLVENGKKPIIFMTRQDSKVDDKICLPLEGTVYHIDQSDRPRIPSTTHQNCRCFWIDGNTGRNLGQF